eukprot:gene11734-24701_t
MARAAVMHGQTKPLCGVAGRLHAEGEGRTWWVLGKQGLTLV